MYDGRNTLYINATIGEEEEEVQDDETRLLAVPVPKMPLGKLVIQTERQ